MKEDLRHPDVIRGEAIADAAVANGTAVDLCMEIHALRRKCLLGRGYSVLPEYEVALERLEGRR